MSGIAYIMLTASRVGHSQALSRAVISQETAATYILYGHTPRRAVVAAYFLERIHEPMPVP